MIEMIKRLANGGDAISAVMPNTAWHSLSKGSAHCQSGMFQMPAQLIAQYRQFSSYKNIDMAEPDRASPHDQYEP